MYSLRTVALVLVSSWKTRNMLVYREYWAVWVSGDVIMEGDEFGQLCVVLLPANAVHSNYTLVFFKLFSATYFDRFEPCLNIISCHASTRIRTEGLRNVSKKPAIRMML